MRPTGSDLGSLLEPHTLAVREILVGIWVAVLVGGCGTGTGIDVDIGARISGPAPPFEDCVADAYVFIGETSVAALGLEEVTRAPVPDPGRIGMIWVTADPLPFDAGPEGGPVEMVRSFCVEYPDGSGLSGWPIDDSWRLPAASGGVATEGPDLPLGLLVLGIGAVLVLGASFLAFRGRKSSSA